MKTALRPTIYVAIAFSLATIVVASILANNAGPSYAQTSLPPVPDPSNQGPHANIAVEDYDLGNYYPPGLNGYPVEMKAEIYYATGSPVSSAPFFDPILYNMPLVIILHGRHFTCYDSQSPDADDYFALGLIWPCNSRGQSWLSIENYRGYEYIGRQLASYGYLVVSISANGISAVDNPPGVLDYGMRARAELIHQHLGEWAEWNTTGNYPGPNPYEWIGRVDFQHIGYIGHSRGGEGIMKFQDMNRLDWGYNVSALLPIAPTNFYRENIGVSTQAPVGTILGYCDGDVRDLEGVHYVDDLEDLNTLSQPSFAFLQLGATHNSYNTNWSYEYCCHGRVDEWDGSLHNLVGGGGVPGGASDSACRRAVRLTPANQRSSSLAYITAFFFTFLTNNAEPTKYQFYPHLTGAVDPPSAVQQANAKIYITYNPGFGTDMRRDINALSNTNNLNTNILGGAVSYPGLGSWGMCGPTTGSYWCQPPVYPFPQSSIDPRQPHVSAYSGYESFGVLKQLYLNWNSGGASYANAIPGASTYSNFTTFEALQFRVGINPTNTWNPLGSTRNFSVQLIDGSGHNSSVTIGQIYFPPRPYPLYYPPGSSPVAGSVVPVPHTMLTTVRMPIRLFDQGVVNLKGITDVKFNFNVSGNTSGSILVSDLSLTNSQCVVPPPTTGCQTFQDVVTGDPYQPYIGVLACQTWQYAYIVSGYTCGSTGEPCVCPDRYSYFRETNNLSRGQLSKIVAMSAHFPEDPSGQYFYDVQAGSTFYKWVQQMANRGYINGYACGGAGEPCVPPLNLPYFRPNGTITRGQLAKIVSNAAGFTEAHTEQTFEDVPIGNVFHDFIQRLYSRAIINGYACGGSNEPCIPPNNRPYYRPWNNVNRGQAAKVDAKTFFYTYLEGIIPNPMPTAGMAVPPPISTP